jgi:hypothetical protein
MLVLAIGDTDCEALGTGWLAQPTNATSSLAYVVVAVVIAQRAHRSSVDRVRSSVYAVCVAGVGVGSILFHGPQPPGSRLLHDVPILLTVLFIVVEDLKELRRRPRNDLGAFAVAGAIGTALSALRADIGAALTGAGVGVLATMEGLIFRSRRPINRAQKRAYAAIIGVAGMAAASCLLGRTGSPACHPDGIFQFHGLWHVFSSLVFGLWWRLAVWLPSRDGQASRLSVPSPMHPADFS